MKSIADERLSQIHRIVDELDSSSDRCVAVSELENAEELLELARHYNWGDGFAVPHGIIDHPACDLGLALYVFELAEGVVWLTSDDEWEYQEEWAGFCKELAKRIQSRHYTRITIPFESEFSKVQRFKAKKEGVPDIFLDSVYPEPTKS